MKYVLILIYLGAAHQHDELPGYESEAECQAAARDRTGDNRDGQVVFVSADGTLMAICKPQKEPK